MFRSLALALALALTIAPAFAQDPKPQDAKPAATSADFPKLFESWNNLLKQLSDFQIQYKSVKPADRPMIEAEFNKLVASGRDLQPKLRAAAQAAFKADSKNKDAIEVLLSFIYEDKNHDRYDSMLHDAQVMIDGKFDNARIYDLAAVAAYNSNDFDKAETYLKEADSKSALSTQSRGLLDGIADAKAKWAKEKQVREAEAKANDLPRVELDTNKGKIVIELYENEAPNTVANFISLIEKKKYDGLTFHRVLGGFMAQGGDPNGDGTGGPGYSVKCECYEPNHRNHFRGTLSMAHSGRDTGGSQFFITFGRTAHLDGKHTAFRHVIEGFDVLSDLQRRNPEEPNQPDPDKIVTAKVIRKRMHPYEPQTLPGK